MPTDIVPTDRDYNVEHDFNSDVLLVEGDVYNFEAYLPPDFNVKDQDHVSTALDIVQDKEKDLYRSIEGGEVKTLIPYCTYHMDDRDMMLVSIDMSVRQYDTRSGEAVMGNDVTLHFRHEWDHYGPMWTDHPVSGNNTAGISPPENRVPVFPKGDMFRDTEDTDTEPTSADMIQE